MSRTKHARRSREEKRLEREARDRIEKQAAIREMMNMYETRRAAWIQHFGSDDGFDSWFTIAFGTSIQKVPAP